MDFYAQGLKLSAAGRHSEAITLYERALASNPADTRTLFALGNTARALGMREAAEQFYRQVLTLQPGRLEALINLSSLLRANGQFAAAENLIRPALAQSPENPDLLTAMGSICRETGNPDEAAMLYRAALDKKPGNVTALVNLADILADTPQKSEALALYDRALRSDNENAQARLNRAILHLLMGNLKDGWRDYAARLKVAGKAPIPDHGLKRWDGTSLKRTRLLVTTEQGVGDHLMFASLLPELCARATADGGSVILECEPRLHSLFARSFPGAKVHDWDIESKGGVPRTHYGWLKAMGGANAAIELGSLPRLFRKTPEAFPTPHAYLKADPAEIAYWHQTFAALPRPLTAICWRSGSVGGARAVQYATLEHWADFLRDLPGTVIVAQYDAKPDEIAALQALSGRTLVVPEEIDQKHELDRTGALLSVCDSVVTAPTAVSWLAAGLGRPTFKILYDTSWTSFGQTYEPFAPSARCLMPKRQGDWTDVLSQAKAAITSLGA